eukprot:GHVO01040841.1.p1 GENE.GHVO01040841.1~~GHVO01040841.1.p1  ORF type:complete len:250 (+),score=45.88 GHVO01040841.1:25-750(+)
MSATRISRRLAKGSAVVVHCSDGWDRTAQLTSLAMLLIDPFYRSIRGLIHLIEKEFLYFGHRFHQRYGHPGPIQVAPPPSTDSVSPHTHAPPTNAPPTEKEDESQKSPIFHQWLHCVYQCVRQHPDEFEYTEYALLAIADAVTSCYFGTFLLNTYEQRCKLRVDKHCTSFWSYLLKMSPHISNPFWAPKCGDTIGPPLEIATDPFNMSVWVLFWTRRHPLHTSFTGGPSVCAPPPMCTPHP